MEHAKISTNILFLLSFVLVACSGGVHLKVDSITHSGEECVGTVKPETILTALRESADAGVETDICVETKTPSSQKYGSNDVDEDDGRVQHKSTTIPAIETTGEISWIYNCSPLASVPIEDLWLIVSAPYAPPPAGSDERHHGVDFAYYRKYGRETVSGEQVQAVLPGKVASVILDSFPYGNYVIIETPFESLPLDFVRNEGIKPGESLYFLYAHLAWVAEIEQGEQIDSCQVIGAVGKSGNACVAHLHLEARIGPAGGRFNRMAYYTVEVSQEEREIYLRWRTNGQYRHFDPMKLLLNDVRD